MGVAGDLRRSAGDFAGGGLKIGREQADGLDTARD